MTSTLTLALAAAVIAIHLPVQAQGLAEALERAWSRHPLAAAHAARSDEARARLEGTTGTTPGPAALSLAAAGDRLQANRGQREWEIELAVPLWLPGQRAARGAAAQGALALIDAQAQALRLQIAGELRDAWWAMAAARQARELAQRRVASARGLETDVQRRFEAGEVARLEANLARAERIGAEAEAAEAATALQLAEGAWRQQTGAAAPAELGDEAEPAASAMAAPEPDATHPQQAAAAAMVRLAQARLAAVDVSRRDAPELALRMTRDRGEFGSPYATAMGVKLTIPFSLPARVRQDGAEARAELAQAEAEQAQVRQRLALDLERARRDLDLARRQLELARQRHALAADNLALGERAFALGEFDLPTLLRLRAAEHEAQALLDRQRVARSATTSRLQQALGVLP